MNTILSKQKSRFFKLDSKRKHTEAEVELVGSLFRCSASEARSILEAPVSLAKRAEVRGMLDAVLVEQDIAKGRVLRVPAWLIKPEAPQA